jgi:hypothetical protein
LVDPILKGVEDFDFEFENTPTRVVAVKHIPEIEVGGTAIGPFDEDREFEVRYWIAYELIKSGFARFLEGYPLDLVSLNKIQWKEPIQPGVKLSTLPKYFYPRLRRYLSQCKENAVNDVSSSEKYSKASRLTQDIIGCRLKKIVNLAASPVQTDNSLQTMTVEERIFYDAVHSLVSDWKKKILRLDTSK